MNESTTTYTRSPLELSLLLIWTSGSLVAALAGNSFILLAVHRRAFRIDKLSMLIIRNLAISDIYFNLIWVLPTLVSLCEGNRWVLGKLLCSVTTYLQYPPAIATIFFITILSVNKWMRIRFPLKTLDISTKTVYIITISVWAFSFVHPSSYFFSNLAKPDDMRRMEMDPYKGSCDYHHSDHLALYWNVLDLLCALACCLTPSVILLAANLAILYRVKKKGRGTLKRSTLILILSLTSMFFISYTPYTVKYVVPLLKLGKNILPDGFIVLTYFLLYANSWANFFIYYLTNMHFRRFVLVTIGGEKPSTSTDKLASVVEFQRTRTSRITSRTRTLNLLRNVHVQPRGSTVSEGG